MRSLFFTLLITLPLFSQHRHEGGMEPREIKALSEEQLRGLRNGEGMGLALPAELNGYPGPKHVLELVDELRLTPEQRTAVEMAWKVMHEEAVRLGGEIIELERQLDALFAAGKADAASIEALTSAIGAKQGALRRSHLVAHLTMRQLLTEEQVRHYRHARGHH